jgi:hypothetical protein
VPKRPVEPLVGKAGPEIADEHILGLPAREYDPVEVFQKRLGDEGVNPKSSSKRSAAPAGV